MNPSLIPESGRLKQGSYRMELGSDRLQTPISASRAETDAARSWYVAAQADTGVAQAYVG